MPTSRRTSPMRGKTPQQPNPLLRVLLAAAAVGLIVLLSAGMTRLLQKPSADVLAAAQGITPAPPTPEPTPSPEPTITPTPPMYAPFGAQYGYGGEELLPHTPTPAPDVRTATPSPVAPAATTARLLKKGMSGSDVTRLQQALADLGYLSDTADGQFGTNTQNAVILFQAVNGLSADGLAGEQTLALLYSGRALSAAEAPPMDYLVLINREQPVDQNYVPMDLVKIEDVLSGDVVKVKYSGTRANRTATEALGKMLEAAMEDGLDHFQISSAYRTYAEQQQLVDNSVAEYRSKNPSWSRDRCLSATYQTVAPAGTSEHQSGLAFDITVPGVSFTGTEQQKWLHEHCTEYGFIVRFTEEKRSITGFLAESWHFRYVGVEAAEVMEKNNWCLEEYIEHMNL